MSEPVSPADTIRRDAVEKLRELVELHKLRAAKGRPPYAALSITPEDAAALLAVGERDKAEIERLRTGWDQREAAITSLEVILFGNDLARSRDELEARAEQYVEAGERDRRQIAQLTEALTKATWHLANYTFRGKDTSLGEEAARLFDEYLSAAVLADEEDSG